MTTHVFFNTEAINYLLKTSIKDKQSYLFFCVSFIFKKQERKYIFYYHTDFYLAGVY